ncbi:hypothetical protein BFW01_g1515 [Lasiodiplodia theobromae]|nr:hypothetical protein BFW01_g1515 [Lasiodiplodia theobromae]
MDDWMICVPTEQLDKAADLFRAEKERYEPFMPSIMTRPHDMSQIYPRFKFKGIALFFYLLPSKACHIVCEPQNIERSDNGIPYPQLHVFAQSLLDTGNFLDLEDLIDAMNLTPEWGEQNLHLDGKIDEDWLLWRKSALQGQDPDLLPLYSPNLKRLPKRREEWMKKASAEAKKARQGYKYREGMATRWRREGSKDPRIWTRKFC